MTWVQVTYEGAATGTARRAKLQVNHGVLANADGTPVSVVQGQYTVIPGPWLPKVKGMRQRFAIERFAPVRSAALWMDLLDWRHPGFPGERRVAANLRTSRSALGAYYRRLCGRMDKPKAITAAAPKLARIIYAILTQGQDYADAGQDYYEQRYQQRVLANLKRRAQHLGFELQPIAELADKPTSA